MDIGEGKCCEMCRTDDSQTCTRKQIIHYMLRKIIKKKKETSNFRIHTFSMFYTFLQLQRTPGKKINTIYITTPCFAF